MIALTLALKYWREGVIAIAVLWLLAACHSRDNALRREGIATEQRNEAVAQKRALDSSYRLVLTQRQRVDTEYVQASKTLTRLVSKTDTLRDTLLAHLTDTLIVKQFVATTDSTQQACHDVDLSCGEKVRARDAQIAILTAKLVACPVLPVPSRGHWGLGATAGIGTTHGFTGRTAIGPSVTIGATYRW